MIFRAAILSLLLFMGQDGKGAISGDRAGNLRPTLPVLDFPEPGLDDREAYQGYQTRFYRDTRENTVQVYLEPRGGRVVTLWANAANESVGFTVRDNAGRPVRLTWDAAAAEITDSSAARRIEYRLTAEASGIQLGGFLLGSMRIERDYQYAKRHLQPLPPSAFRAAEESLLVDAVSRLPASERARHLAALRAKDIKTLRSRLAPTLTSACSDVLCTVRAERPSLDGRNRLGIEIRTDPRRVKVQLSGQRVSIRTRPGARVGFAVSITTDAPALTPLQRREIFKPAFLQFLDRAAAATDSAGRIRYRRMERQVRAVELLSSKEKLMAGLPNYATYFGRDMMMTALMMRPVWTTGMSEHVIASVLRKLGPGGEVSHEEALGGQAIRENAVVYDSLVTEYLRADRAGRGQQADGILHRALGVLGELQKTRENYHMIDDEFQLAVLVARYLSDSAVAPSQKRAFLLDSSNGSSRLASLLSELALVAKWTRAYAENPRVDNLVSFPQRNAGHWRSASWRDSDAGYAGGRFAMDVNAIWAPQALHSLAVILSRLPALGITPQELEAATGRVAGTSLAEYLRHPASLHRATEIWRGARWHFEVTLGPEEVRRRVGAKLAWLPAAERRYWEKVVARVPPDSVFFLALSLDAEGSPVPVVNTDPATGLFLEAVSASKDSAARLAGTAPRDLSTFLLPYPVGLLVDSLGPLVANDAYASRQVWERFRTDTYHSPRVVWGREVNLLFLGLANQIRDGGDTMAQTLLRRTTAAVNASGLGHNELWGCRIDGGRLLPVRHAGQEMSTDIQLWNTTDLAVEFVLSRLPSP